MIIYMMVGLPASGKSTYAKGLIDSNNNIKRISKDDLREMFQSGKYTPDSELWILFIRDNLIRLLLEDGYDVVVDDTNLNPKHKTALESLARSFGAEIKPVIIDTSIDECVIRDSKRNKPVGEKVIRDMYEKYLVNGLWHQS